MRSPSVGRSRIEKGSIARRAAASNQKTKSEKAGQAGSSENESKAEDDEAESRNKKSQQQPGEPFCSSFMDLRGWNIRAGRRGMAVRVAFSPSFSPAA